jgi:immune inhibitor A
VEAATLAPQATASFEPQTTLPAPENPQQEGFPKSTADASAQAADPETVAANTQATLENIPVPASDLFDLAFRLAGKDNISPTLEPPAIPYQIGTQKPFWILNTDTNQNIQVQTIMQYATDHLYFWVEAGLPFDENALRELADEFESRIYPTNREFFGSEWTPGIDGDSRLHVVYARELGNSISGYFSTNDEYPPVLSEYSNGHEMFFLNADQLTLDREFTYGTLAHEFQHMIHWNQDRNEDTWMSEGLADLAMLLNGYGTGGADYSYVANPDIQFTNWPTQPEFRTPYYGGSFLYLAYFLDRFGEQAMQKLSSHPANGLASVDQTLAELGITDPETGKPITGDDVFADWAAALYLRDEQVGDGRYTYTNYPKAPRPDETEIVRGCPNGVARRDVHQFGVDYIRIRCRGDFTLEFSGNNQVPLVPTDPHSGEFAFWSNRGDVADMTLTRTFDFRDVTGPITMSYWTWYDLENSYDYLYLEASRDGERWEILTTPSGTPEDPVGNSFGWGYNGTSGGGETPRWVQEQIDLSQFAGQQVTLRFEYVTDAEVNGEGFLLDDISVPQVDYFSDFEADDGGWEAQGFARVQNVLPQTYRLSVIKLGDTTTVEKFSLSGDNQLQIPMEFGNGVNEIVLVVSGTSRFTNQLANYQYSLK